ncbi:MAG: tRNA glutamyl-Q(34) synthetase GluQRS [Sphingomicrobium sp.]
MITTRFAPSPTGRLHLGHALSAVFGHQQAHRGGAKGKFLVRIEDLDQGRARAEFVDGIFEDLDWLGLVPAQPPLIQSQRTAAYADALDALRGQGLVYACFCTRADIAAALAAPQGAAAAHYPGTCRHLPDDPARRSAEAHSWRLDVERALARTGLPIWREGARTFAAARADLDDIILARKDAPAAYHLACVVADAASGISLVTRGADLRSSTPVQRLLQLLLDLPQPDYLHHRLVAHADGRRLAKRDQAPTLAAMRAAGTDGRELAYRLKAGELPLGFAFLED